VITLLRYYRLQHEERQRPIGLKTRVSRGSTPVMLFTGFSEDYAVGAPCERFRRQAHIPRYDTCVMGVHSKLKRPRSTTKSRFPDENGNVVQHHHDNPGPLGRRNRMRMKFAPAGHGGTAGAILAEDLRTDHGALLLQRGPFCQTCAQPFA